LLHTKYICPLFYSLLFGNILKVSRIPNFFQREKILALLVGSSKISSVTHAYIMISISEMSWNACKALTDNRCNEDKSRRNKKQNQKKKKNQKNTHYKL
jgi:hypothetical protein